MTGGWEHHLKIGQAGRGVTEVDLAPDDAQRKTIARRLGLAGLPRLSARVSVRPWMDGVRIQGRFDAHVEQVCGVSLETFEHALAGKIDVRAVPAGSPSAPALESGEADLDPEADDPPDVLEGDVVDLAEYVVEHLALEIDPFPRKPGATFEYAPPAAEDSPFAALKGLKDKGR